VLFITRDVTEAEKSASVEFQKNCASSKKTVKGSV